MKTLLIAILISLLAVTVASAQVSSFVKTSKVIYVKVPVIEYTYKVRVPMVPQVAPRPVCVPPLPRPVCVPPLPRPFVPVVKPVNYWYQNGYVYIR